MNRILLSLLLCLCALQSSAQEDTRVKVFLTNGDAISGTLLEYTPGEHLTIRTVGDNVLTIPQAQIQSINMGEGGQATPPVPSAAAVPADSKKGTGTLGNVYFESHTEALMAVGLGASKKEFSNTGLFFGAYSANGVGIRQTVFIGLGVGFHGHTEKPSFGIPLALDVRWRMLKGRKFSPIMAGMGGMGYHEGGLGSYLFGGSAGLNISMKEKLGLNLMFFYHYQKFDRGLTAGGAQAIGPLSNVEFSYLGLRVGIQLKAGGK